MWLYFVKTIVNSLRQEYLHYGWEGVAKETWFYTINFWDCLNGLIRDMSNQLWVIIIIGKILRGFRHRKYFRSSSQRIWGRFWPTNSLKNHGRMPRENINLWNELTLQKSLKFPEAIKLSTVKIKLLQAYSHYPRYALIPQNAKSNRIADFMNLSVASVTFFVPNSQNLFRRFFHPDLEFKKHFLHFLILSFREIKILFLPKVQF